MTQQEIGPTWHSTWELLAIGIPPEANTARAYEPAEASHHVMGAGQ